MISPYRAILVLTAVSAAAVPGCKKSSNSPAAGTATATVTEPKISDVELGRRISADKRVADATDKFSPRDTIYVVAVTEGSSPNATLTARWTYADGGQVVKEDSRSIAASGTDATEFHISKPSGWPKGKYNVTVTLGGSTESKDFEVK